MSGSHPAESTSAEPPPDEEPQPDASSYPASPVCSPRKRQLMQHIRSAASAVTCPTLLEVQSRLPANFPQPEPSDVRLFHLAIQDNCRRLVDRLVAQFPTIVLHHHYDETPLIAAIRCDLEDLAIHLVEHGASVSCTKLLFDSLGCGGGGASLDWYEVSAREMAYERRMLQLLELIDYLTGNFFAYLKPPAIAIRMLRPVKSPGAGSVDTSDAFDIPEDFFTDTYVKPADPVVIRRRRLPKIKLPAGAASDGQQKMQKRVTKQNG